MRSTAGVNSAIRRPGTCRSLSNGLKAPFATLRSAYQLSDAARQLAAHKRFLQVIEAGEAVPCIIARNDQYREILAALVNQGHQLKTVHAGHGQIRDARVNIVTETGQSVGAIAGLDHRKPLHFERQSEKCTNPRIVIDD